MPARGWVVLGAVVAMGAMGPEAQAQNRVGDRAINADGWTSFQVDVDEDTWICENGSFRNSNGSSWNRGRMEGCVRGVMEVVVRARDGLILDLDTQPPESRRGPDVDRAYAFGPVPGEDAGTFLIGLVPRTNEDVAEDAIGAAAMLDGVTLWPDFERFARDRSLPEDVRTSAIFWLGQEAVAEATRGITAIIESDDEEIDVKEAAVFALSQRPRDVALPLLMEVAEDVNHPEVKRSAMFWLAQYDDERVIEFFKRILEGS